MPNKYPIEFEIIKKGNLVLLRNRIDTDRNHYQRWLTQGEWLEYDAPWETPPKPAKSDPKQVEKDKKVEKDVGVKKMAIITTLDQKPLGWVSRYGDLNNPDVFFIGINICEDHYLNKGYGTEALRLWADYLFSGSKVHKICLDTWSFNPRMVRVAEKLGFKYEGSQREIRYWEGEWLDAVHFGILREEWARKKE